MADSFHDLPPHPRHHTVAEVVLAATVAPMYRVICPDGRPYDDVDTADAALEAAKYADAMHDNAICDGRRLDDQEHDWTLRAACKNADPNLFFVEQGQSANPAKQVCARCEVRATCLDYAVRHDIRHGVWGGRGEKERRSMRGLREARG